MIIICNNKCSIRVLYFSIHRYEHGQFWPNLRESDFDHIGNGSGTGFNVNVPLNDIGMKNEDYLAIVHNLLIPLATEVIINNNKNVPTMITNTSHNYQFG